MIPDGVVPHAGTAPTDHTSNTATDKPNLLVFTLPHPFLPRGVEALRVRITVLPAVQEDEFGSHRSTACWPMRGTMGNTTTFWPVNARGSAAGKRLTAC